jgi:MerR family transcriptional regulator, copper efflux regulator
MDSQKHLLTIQQLSDELRIPKPTLRYWEKEFKEFLTPVRTSGGQRRYTPENIGRIQQIKRFREQGISLAEIRRKIGNGQGFDEESLQSVTSLADRIAEVVREEVRKLLAKEKGF